MAWLHGYLLPCARLPSNRDTERRIHSTASRVVRHRPTDHGDHPQRPISVIDSMQRFLIRAARLRRQCVVLNRYSNSLRQLRPDRSAPEEMFIPVNVPTRARLHVCECVCERESSLLRRFMIKSKDSFQSTPKSKRTVA